MSWGRGWEVGLRKAIWSQERAQKLAAEILAEEHGVMHDAGSRPDLCPKCQQSTPQVGQERTAP